MSAGPWRASPPPGRLRTERRQASHHHPPPTSHTTPGRATDPSPQVRTRTPTRPADPPHGLASKLRSRTQQQPAPTPTARPRRPHPPTRPPISCRHSRPCLTGAALSRQSRRSAHHRRGGTHQRCGTVRLPGDGAPARRCRAERGDPMTGISPTPILDRVSASAQ